MNRRQLAAAVYFDDVEKSYIYPSLIHLFICLQRQEKYKEKSTPVRVHCDVPQCVKQLKEAAALQCLMHSLIHAFMSAVDTLADDTVLMRLFSVKLSDESKRLDDKT